MNNYGRMTEPRLSRVGLYKDREGLWRWRAIALNHEIVAVSESYVRRKDAVDEAVNLWPDIEISEEDE